MSGGGRFGAATAALLLACGLSTSCSREPVRPPAPPEPAGRVLEEVPAHPDPDARHLLYLHGRILEEQGPEAEHPRFGRYRYAEILDTFADAGLDVVSWLRPQGTTVQDAADSAAGAVRHLLDAGVPPASITVVGFSKGAIAAILASSRVAEDDVSYVVLAGCGRWIGRAADLHPRGRFLSIYDSSDGMVSSCGPLFTLLPEGGRRAEIVLGTGAEHGTFYAPRPEWVEPTVRWALGEMLEGSEQTAAQPSVTDE